MSNKPKKKRTKQYTGVGAALSRPTVTRISAANRTKFGQWWFEHKRVMKPVIIISLVVVGVVLLIFQIISLVN